jgi:exopolyphosphatase/guanosine-5'-triphosphate,3'-diphosphate pyrophosphatase
MAAYERPRVDLRVIGSGGTFATLAAMALGRRGDSDRTIQGTELLPSEIEELLNYLAGLTPKQRRNVPGLRPERADIILAGLVVVLELLARIEATSVKINAYGLREGLLLEMRTGHYSP